jgi:hypothetical protein
MAIAAAWLRLRLFRTVLLFVRLRAFFRLRFWRVVSKCLLVSRSPLVFQTGPELKKAAEKKSMSKDFITSAAKAALILYCIWHG